MEQKTGLPEEPVVFLNQPKLSDHEADKKFNDRRLALLPHLKEFLETDGHFRGKAVSVTFSHAGVSSLVAIVETPEEKFVIKIPLRNDKVGGEAAFLRAWESAGVAVPHVFEEGVIGGHSFALMQYIEASTFEKTGLQELLDREIFFEQGRTLRKMHQPKTEGYGRIREGKAEYNDFEGWLSGMLEKYKADLEEKGLLQPDIHGSLDTAAEILRTYSKNNPESCYCHYDFGSHNVFDTKPLTVFDPNPMLNISYIDIGRSLVLAATLNNRKVTDQILKGYESDGPIDRKVLQAAILVASLEKFTYWNQIKKTGRIRNVQNYLAETKHFLDQ